MNASVNNFPKKRQMTSSGFTLIELMVTIAVLAIIVSIAAPNISTQLANQRVKSTAATLANALKEAKVESFLRRQKITLTYDNISTPKVIAITAPGSTIIASYSYNSKSVIKPNAATPTIFEPSKQVATALTYTVCDSYSGATSRQIEIDKVANITIKVGGTCS